MQRNFKLLREPDWRVKCQKSRASSGRSVSDDDQNLHGSKLRSADQDFCLMVRYRQVCWIPH